MFHILGPFLKVTLAALGEIFEAARGIMGWLGDCAKVCHSDMFWAVGCLLSI